VSADVRLAGAKHPAQRLLVALRRRRNGLTCTAVEPGSRTGPASLRIARLAAAERVDDRPLPLRLRGPCAVEHARRRDVRPAHAAATGTGSLALTAGGASQPRDRNFATS
jgi:hypothetical protein